MPSACPIARRGRRGSVAISLLITVMCLHRGHAWTLAEFVPELVALRNQRRGRTISGPSNVTIVTPGLIAALRRRALAM